MRKVDLIIVHCTATEEGREYSVADVDRWHRERGFKMIGYHYLVHLDGTVEAGRPEEMVGAHCKGHNAHSIGVCYVGGLKRPHTPGGNAKPEPADTRTEAQKESLKRLIGELKERYPGAVAKGHNAFARKACPCYEVEE